MYFGKPQFPKKDLSVWQIQIGAKIYEGNFGHINYNGLKNCGNYSIMIV